ncbi:MAG: c-type cytochrome [Planctomycetes bacterium]|nr:c-type cytochrome [Planctomycetota bacterium]
MSNREVNDPLLEHTYDGIQEYDNPLPGWWVMIFWASIFFCVPYTIYVHFMDGNTVLDAYEADMAANTLNWNLTADAATILGLRDDAEKLEIAEGIFASKCSACHKPDGSGQLSLGPNLTDKYWKNVKSLTDIYDVISNGVTGTAMTPQTVLSKDERILMAAYVAHLALEFKEGLPPEGVEIATWPSEKE